MFVVISESKGVIHSSFFIYLFVVQLQVKTQCIHV